MIKYNIILHHIYTMGDVIAKYRLHRGSSQALIGALIRAAESADKTERPAFLYYGFERGTDGNSSGFVTVETSPRTGNTFDTLIMEVAPGTIMGDPPYPPHTMIQDARNIILRLYRRLYYRGYDQQMRNDPDKAKAWRAKRNESNRRYRNKMSGNESTSGL